MHNPYAPPADTVNAPPPGPHNASAYGAAWGAFVKSLPILGPLALAQATASWALAVPGNQDSTEQSALLRAMLLQFGGDLALNAALLPVVALLALWRLSPGAGLADLFRRGYARLLAFALVFEFITMFGDGLCCVPGVLARLGAFALLDPVSFAIGRRGLFAPSNQAQARLVLLAPWAIAMSLWRMGLGVLSFNNQSAPLVIGVNTLCALATAFCWFLWVAVGVADRPGGGAA